MLIVKFQWKRFLGQGEVKTEKGRMPAMVRRVTRGRDHGIRAVDTHVLEE